MSLRKAWKIEKYPLENETLKSRFGRYLLQEDQPLEQLLRTRLCDLEIAIEDSGVATLIRQVRTELKRKGLLFKPYFWISDEWFCPDGFSGVAIPFFLLHPRLKRLEKAKMGFVDGHSTPQILKILRHEIGHALENAYGLKSHPLRKKVFGSHREPYPSSYHPRPYSRHFVKHLGFGYGQCHPDEDFAETFAVWLDSSSDWKKKYIGTPAFYKLLAMDQLMKELRGVTTERGQRGRFEPLSANKITLGEYYRRKQLRFRIPTRKKMVHDVMSLKDDSLGTITLAQYMRKNEKLLVDEVSSAIGQPKHLVRRVVSDFISAGTQVRIKSSDQKELKAKTLNWVLEGSLIYLEKGLDRVVL